MKSLPLVAVVFFVTHAIGINNELLEDDNRMTSSYVKLLPSDTTDTSSASCARGWQACREMLARHRCAAPPPLLPLGWGMLGGKRGADDALGPFWANRGKRDPNYTLSRLYAEEPHWELVQRRANQQSSDDGLFDPYFTTRGKKQTGAGGSGNVFVDGTPFLAARGKKQTD